MGAVRELERAVEEYGFVGAHGYPHWFELAPGHNIGKARFRLVRRSVREAAAAPIATVELFT